METVKRRVLLEDFINRANSKFIAIDKTNENKSQNERSNIWGKIPMDIVIDNTDPLLMIGLEWEYMGDNYVPDPMYTYHNKHDKYLTFENINNIYKEDTETTNEDGITTYSTKYYSVVYTDVLSFIEKEILDNDNKVYVNVLRYNTLLKYYRFLKYLRLNVTLYHKCNNRFFEIYDKPYSTPEEDGTIYDAFYAYFFTNKDGAIIRNSNEDIRIVSNTENVDSEGVTMFGDIGFYGEVPSDMENTEDIICVTKQKYADLFNSLFRRNKKERYECLLWELAERVIDGDVNIKGIEPTIDIPLYIESNINSMGLYDTFNREDFNGVMCDTYTEYVDNTNIKYNTDGENTKYLVNGSKLSELRRNLQRRLSESDEGETLSFVIKEEVNNNIVDITTEVPYLLGRTNTIRGAKYGSAYYTVDVLDKIIFTDINENNEETIAEWVYERDYNRVKRTINGKDEYSHDTKILCSDLVRETGAERVGMKGTIEFEYTLNVLLEDNDDLIPNTGVKHTEKYNFEVKLSQPIVYKLSEEEKNDIKYSTTLKKMLSVVDVEYTEDQEDPLLTYDEAKHKTFKNIGEIYKTTEIDENGTNVIKYKQVVLLMDIIEIDYDYNADGNIDDVPMVDISYYANNINNEKMFTKNYVYKPNYLDDVEFINEQITDGDLVGRINIERSKSSAFERHNIMCEVNTMQDLENYRNDFFKIRN